MNDPEVDGNLHYWKIDNWGEECFGSHGTLFLGAFLDSGRILFPVMLLCDEDGQYIDFSEDDIVSALGQADDSDVKYFKPTDSEVKEYQKIYDRLTSEMLQRYQTSVVLLKAYNKRKVENWAEIQMEQLNIEISDMLSGIEEQEEAEKEIKDFNDQLNINPILLVNIVLRF